MKVTKEQIYDGFRKFKRAAKSAGLKIDLDNRVFVDSNGNTYNEYEAQQLYELFKKSGLLDVEKYLGDMHKKNISGGSRVITDRGYFSIEQNIVDAFISELAHRTGKFLL